MKTTLAIADFTDIAARSDAAAALLRSMAHPARLQILCLLNGGELSVGEINARVALSQSALSQHLALLREQQLVTTRREDQNILYSVPPGPALQVLAGLHAAFCKPADHERRP